MLNRSILTISEEFQMFGEITGSRAEEAMNAIVMGENVPSIKAHIDEACAMFPDEDFTAEIIIEMRGLAKRIRGENRAEMLQLIEKLEAKNEEVWQAAEYGVDELKKALKVISGEAQ